ncbi:TRF2-interacting telomeric protein/Rap1 C terminal domain-containing protein [Cryomyces antarcticus]
MSEAQVVYSRIDNDDTTVRGRLFAGLKFFILQRVPARAQFVSQVGSNGGQIVKMESQADYVIADHARADAPPGSISWRFIEHSLRNGALEDPKAHPAGRPAGRITPAVGVVRPPGAGKTGRVPFSPEDDRVLYEWVEEHRKRGGAVLGNKIYQQLEAINPRHTSQSWRDRYVKHLSIRAPAGRASHGPPSAPSAAHQCTAATSDTPERTVEEKLARDNAPASPAFTHRDFVELLKCVPNLQVTTAFDRHQEAFDALAKEFPEHTADAWRKFYEDKVLPVYLENRRMAEEEGMFEEAEEEETASKIGYADRNSTEGQPPSGSTSPSARVLLQRATALPSTPRQHTPQASVHASTEKTPQETDVDVILHSETHVEVMVPIRSSHSKRTPLRGSDGRFTLDRTIDSPKRKRGRTLSAESEEPESHGLDDEPIHKKLRLQNQSSDVYVSAQEHVRESVEETPGSIIKDSTKETIILSSDDENDEDEDEDEIVNNAQPAGKAIIANLTKENLVFSQVESGATDAKRAFDLDEDEQDSDQEEFATYLEGLTRSAVAEVRQHHEEEEEGESEDDLSELAMKDDQRGSARQVLARDPDSLFVEDDEPKSNSLPEPTHRGLIETQYIDPNLDGYAETQYIDLNMDAYAETQNIDSNVEAYADFDDEVNLTEPEDGSPEPIPSLQASPQRSPVRSTQRNGRRQHTQAILDIETQDPDFSVPEPGSGFSPSPQPRSADEPAAAAAEDEEALFDEYFAALLAAGHAEDDISHAIRATSWNPDLVPLVLRHVEAEKRKNKRRRNRRSSLVELEQDLPQDMPGVWTERDDADLEGTDARAVKRVTEKHGVEAMQRRWLFLETWRAV